MTKTTVYNVAVAMTAAWGSFTYGFGFASFSTSIGQPGFYTYFGLTTEPTAPNYAYSNHILGAIQALFFFGACLGALGGGPCADWLGRRLTLFFAALVSIVGGALTAGSVHIAMLIVVRALQGAGLGCLATLVPIYLAEASTPARRGMLTSLHGVFLVSGYTISGWVGFGCYFSKNLTFGWRGPLAFTTIPAIVVALGALWIPESPRFLLMKGEHEQAWTVLSRLHRDADDPDELAAHEEFYQMRVQIEYERSNPSGYWGILTTKSYRHRAFLACFVQFAAQSAAALTISSYSVLIYNELGLTGWVPLLLYACYTLIGALGNVIAVFVIDKIGRRPSLLIGFTGCLIALILETAMVGEFVEAHPNAAGQKVAVFAIFFYVFFYGIFLDAASFVYSSEVYPTNIRSRGVAMATFTYFAGCILYVTPGATAFANIGWKYFLVFVIMTVFSIVIMWFTFPETKGKSLEELAELFGETVVIHLTDATEEEKNKMDMEIKAEINVAHVERLGE
ncbi:sugar transporter family protein [Rhizodiscina lignyota]|uniref:Sugar transporter family protein n=1 Tax=Rhizodiscina lignyota TaxID=1504668 RepID=A0A9P4I2Z0_9PEZI|nr:sugar transporter family protein [Rhizodiscina lignyota]